jgi:predicted GH43/DUF377 family glycosyl hydrolase
MAARPLNRDRDFAAWPPLDPGRFLDMNPSLVATVSGERWVLFCRYPVPPQPGLGSIWAVRVDGDLRPAGRPVLLIGDGIDPRVVACGERLFLFYALLERDADRVIDGSCMVAAEFAVEGERWDCVAAYQLPKFPLGGQLSAEAQDKWEKNWVPFALGADRIGLIYAHEPWDVIVMEVPAGAPPRLSASHRSPGLVWDYGTIRGGTPPVRYDAGRLITFFHAAQVVGSRRVYTAGACVFGDTAPFAPELVTSEPLLVAPYASGAHRFGWGFAGSVVFPAGAEATPEGFTLVSGRDDGEIATFAIPRQVLDRRLAPPTVPETVAFSGSRDGAAARLPLAGLVALPEGIALPDDGPIIAFARIAIGRGRTFVDIGAGAGAFSMALAPRFERVVAFEPDPRLHDWFNRNRSLNGLDGLSCTRGRPGREGVPALDEQDLAAVDLIRCELPDADLTALTGALGLLAASRPLVLCRTGGDPAIRAALEAVMARAGYGVEARFPLTPAWVLCRSEASRQDLAWFL